jgi:hypothetical protein
MKIPGSKDPIERFSPFKNSREAFLQKPNDNKQFANLNHMRVRSGPLVPKNKLIASCSEERIAGALSTSSSTQPNKRTN